MFPNSLDAALRTIGTSSLHNDANSVAWASRCESDGDGDGDGDCPKFAWSKEEDKRMDADIRAVNHSCLARRVSMAVYFVWKWSGGRKFDIIVAEL